MKKISHKLISILPILFGALALASTGLTAPLGDRLILTINGIPYSQLQIEGYLDVKESLRDDLGKSQLVNADNWNVALASFIRDMTLYQEANRTSGFRPNHDLVTKAADRIQQNTEKTPRFKTRFHELGIDLTTIRESAGRVLSIENLRRSRSGMQSIKPMTKPQANASEWEDDLMKRAIIRWFEHGKTYETIQLN